MKNMKEFKGDLLQYVRDGHCDLIIHGCNCFCTMGAGIALQIKNKFPEAYEVDLKTEKGDINKLGNYSYANITRINRNIDHHLSDLHVQFTVINAYTQFHFDASKKPVDYEAITLVLRKINHYYRGKSIGLPKIGAGLAGGDWEKIKGIIEKELNAMSVTIVYYK